MGDPRVQERDNPLVRRLNQVARANEELGTALGGGARPPRPPLGPVMGGTSTVLPPPAVPLSAEEALGDTLPPAEAEELERRWATDPSNPANKIAPDRAITPGPCVTPQADAPLLEVGDLRIDPIYRVDRSQKITPPYLQWIGMLPITDDQKQQVRLWVFEGAAKEIMTETAHRLDAMQEAFGLAPKEEKSEKVPAVPATSSTGQMGEEQGEVERPAELLQGMHGESGSAIKSNTSRKRTKTSTKARTKRARGPLQDKGGTGA